MYSKILKVCEYVKASILEGIIAESMHVSNYNKLSHFLWFAHMS